jgi:hypothetical protein
MPDDESLFKLRCFSCGENCQLGNPPKWNKEQVCQGLPNSTAGTSTAPPHNNQTRLQQILMNPDQCHVFCKLFVKGMVQVQAPSIGSKASAASVVSRQQWGDFGCTSIKRTIRIQLSEPHAWKEWVFICLVMYDLSRSDCRAHCINSLKLG